MPSKQILETILADSNSTPLERSEAQKQLASLSKPFIPERKISPDPSQGLEPSAEPWPEGLFDSLEAIPEPAASEADFFGERDRLLLKAIVMSESDKQAAAIYRLEARWCLTFGNCPPEYFRYLLKHKIRLYKRDVEFLLSTWRGYLADLRRERRKSLTGLESFIYEMALISTSTPDVLEEAMSAILILAKTDPELTPVVGRFLSAVTPEQIKPQAERKAVLEGIDVPALKREAKAFLSAVQGAARCL